MAVLSDAIEQFIKSMMCDGEETLVLKRNELAVRFGCAPSQINYVLATRFTPERGYVVESRRGGGGCIRVVRVRAEYRELMDALVYEKCNDEGLSEAEARSIIIGLHDAGIADAKQAELMAAAVSERALGMNRKDNERLRRDIMRSMTAVLFKEDR